MTHFTSATLAHFIEQHGIVATLIYPDQETPTVTLAAQALDCQPDQIIKSVLILLLDGEAG